jgi:plasmid stabilization system protein ParE
VNASCLVLAAADQDLSEYSRYLATEASIDLALRFLDAAHETFRLLASQPAMGWKCGFSSPEVAAARVFRVSGFPKLMAFYRLGTDGIEVLRVLHGSQNLESLFGSSRG